jgi:hypothetical protein
VVLAYLVIAADVLALTNSPYGANPQIQLARLGTTLTATPGSSYPGGDVNLTASVTDPGTVGVGGIDLTIELSPGLRLVGPPELSRGNGCREGSSIVCRLGFLRPRNKQVANVAFGVRVTERGDQRVGVVATAGGTRRASSVVISVPSG